MKEDGEKMSSTFMGCLIAFVFTLSLLMVMVVVICKKCKRRRAAKLSASRLSLPPPYEVIVNLSTVILIYTTIDLDIFCIVLTCFTVT